MKEKIKDFLSTIGGLGLFLLFVFLFILAFGGGLWLYIHLYKIFIGINDTLFALSIMLFVWSLYSSFREITGVGIFIASWIMGAILWFYSLYVSYSLLGIFWVVIGLLFFGVGVIPLAGIALVIHKEFSIFGQFILSGILILVFRLVGIWILGKFKVARPIVNKTIRFLVAIFVGDLTGMIIILPIFVGLDYILGTNINTTTSPLSFLLIVYMVMIGFTTGFFAAIINQERGKRVAIFAQFTPLIFIIVISLLLNRDLTSFYTVPPAAWIWIGLIPAIIGGHYGEKYIRSKSSEVVSNMAE